MSIESRKERILYQAVVPIAAAILGAIAATWFQSAIIDKTQLADIVHLLKDPQLTAQQKLQGLNIYKEITDRPWSVIRSLVSYLGLSVSMGIGAAVAGGWFQRRN